MLSIENSMKLCRIILIFGIVIMLSLPRGVGTTASEDQKGSDLICKGARIRYYYAFNVILRNEFLTYDNVYEVLSRYSEENEILSSTQFSVQVDSNKVKAVGDFICTQRNLKSEFRLDYYPSVEQCKSLKFEGVDGDEDWVVWYDGRFVIIEVSEEEVCLADVALVFPVLPQTPCRQIIKEITIALCKIYGQEAFKLSMIDCKTEENPGQWNIISFQESLPCELVYIDIDVNELMYKETRNIVASNDELFDYLKEYQKSVYPGLSDPEKGFFIFAVSGVGGPSFTLARVKEKRTYFTDKRISEWSESDVYLNLLEIHRICLEMQNQLEKEIYNIGETSENFRNLRGKEDFESFFKEYEERMMMLNSLDVSLQLSDRYLTNWEKMNAANSHYIQQEIEAKIQEVRNLILQELSYVDILKREMQNEQTMLEAQINKESLEVSNKSLKAANRNLFASYAVLAITVCLLIITIIPRNRQLTKYFSYSKFTCIHKWLKETAKRINNEICGNGEI